MGIFIDPATGQRRSYQQMGDLDEFFSGDLEYDIIGGSEVSTQVLSIISPTRNQQMNLGRSNALQGTDAAIQGAKQPDIGITGENKQTTSRVQIRRRVKV